MNTLENHPIADIFPMMTAEESAALEESIKRSGLRDPIILLDGKVLDGRNRLAACNRAGTTPIFRDFGSDPSDGSSPARFVADKNLTHRFLTTGQKAAAAEELIYWYEQEAGVTKGEAAEIVAAQFNVSPRSVATAAALKKNDPQGFTIVKEGKATLSAAAKKAAKDKKDDKAAEEAEEALNAEERKKESKGITKTMGEAFGVAYDNGVILKTMAEVEAFIKLPKEDQKMIGDLIIRQWSVARALKFMHKILDGDSKISDLILQTLGLGKAHKILVDGFIITARKASADEPAV